MASSECSAYFEEKHVHYLQYIFDTHECAQARIINASYTFASTRTYRGSEVVHRPVFSSTRCGSSQPSELAGAADTMGRGHWMT